MRSAAHALPDIVRIALVLLPAACWPLMIERVCGVTLVWMDPRATRKTLTDALVLGLTDAELVPVREAYGQIPTGPLHQWTQDEAPAILWVPPSLRLRGAPALQGGVELARRQRLGLMAPEIACMKQGVEAMRTLTATAPSACRRRNGSVLVRPERRRYPRREG